MCLICPRVQLLCNTETTLYGENAKCCDFEISYLKCDLLPSGDQTMHHISNMDTSILNLFFSSKTVLLPMPLLIEKYIFIFQ